MKIAASGFVSEQAGSVASANAILLRGLIDAGHEIDFFSKSSFVDPRPSVGGRDRFRFIEANNRFEDRLRARFQRIPVIGFLAVRWDCLTYIRLLARSINNEHQQRRYDVVLWMGEFAPMRISGVPVISFAQGPPGTDARSILARFSEVKKLAGVPSALKWWVLAKLRLSRLGLPRFQYSDMLIVGSEQSRKTLEKLYGVPSCRTAALPYPIDLDLFCPKHRERKDSESLRVLWLGRIIPRKRLDLFLEGLEFAIRQGLNVQATIVGNIGFVPGYERIIASFAFPDRLEWIRQLPRENVPELMHKHDVLVQPSDEENFGSSVAEAQACGLPVIVGRTNGNADYLCSRDIHMADDSPREFATALARVARTLASAPIETGVAESRTLATSFFGLEQVLGRLEQILGGAVMSCSADKAFVPRMNSATCVPKQKSPTNYHNPK